MYMVDILATENTETTENNEKKVKIKKGILNMGNKCEFKVKRIFTIQEYLTKRIKKGYTALDKKKNKIIADRHKFPLR
jgi:hypothetical protein